MDDLRRCLKEIPANDSALIVTEGIFSMEGDIAPLNEIVELAEEFDAGIYVDDAHSIGVLGPNGRGTAAHFGLTKKVGITMGTFSKSFASIGGFVGGDETTCEWIKHSARSLIFSASSPPSAVATILGILDIIEKDDSIRQKLWANAKRLREGYLDVGFNIGMSESPIVPIIIGEEYTTFKFFIELLETEPRGVYTNPVRAPATPPGRELIRTSCLATLDNNIIDEAIEILSKTAKKFEII